MKNIKRITLREHFTIKVGINLIRFNAIYYVFVGCQDKKMQSNNNNNNNKNDRNNSNNTLCITKIKIENLLMITVTACIY